ncbi:hypothetical protein ACFQY4_06805 [Catellatospora bangladeshensis]|uniref:Lipoprotein n=1 Tax=Catellatospora bangladeshensis TaxID=310355 RepID=A0A8J3JIS6_9ACTN|nr:hypothetical protein [Catellatospora bangladeshensis]GIF85562.1 hypothetical protein Cba03nite_69110 [Catellatospora bangladeshensis]
MRRVLATATLGLALLGMAACADPETPSATASSGAPAASSAAPAPAASPMDKTAACEAYMKAESSIKTQLMKLMTEAAAIKADPAKAQQALADLTKAFGEFEAGIAPIAAGATDPELKAAVEADLAVVKKLPADLAATGGDVDKIMAYFEGPAFASAGEKVYALCGK